MTDPRDSRGPLEPDAVNSRTSGSEGAGERQRSPATRLSHRTQRAVPKRRRARRPLIQGLGQAACYAAAATLAGGLVRELLQLAHMSATSC